LYKAWFKKVELFYTISNKHFDFCRPYKSRRLLNISSREWEKERVEKYQKKGARGKERKRESEATQRREKKRVKEWSARSDAHVYDGAGL